MTTTNGIVNGLAAYQKDIGNKDYEDGWERIFGNKKKANNKDNKKRIRKNG